MNASEKWARRERLLEKELQVPLNELKIAIARGSTDFEIAELLDIDVDALHDVAYYCNKERNAITIKEV